MTALLNLAQRIEAQLVARDLRGMQHLAQALEPGYCLRAAQALFAAERVLIGTGFPVRGTFETDGPAGALALYGALVELGVDCHLACAAPLADALRGDYRVLELRAFDVAAGRAEAQSALAELQPDVVVSIERPGLAADGRYYNMRGEDISEACAVFDYYLSLAEVTTIAIGDGGNEIGMGLVADAVSTLDIRGAATVCDELIVADVSNWGAYALVALLEALAHQASRPEALLLRIDHLKLLRYLSERGSVDGVTRANTLTEDGLTASAGLEILEFLRGELRRWKHEPGRLEE